MKSFVFSMTRKLIEEQTKRFSFAKTLVFCLKKIKEKSVIILTALASSFINAPTLNPVRNFSSENIPAKHKI